ncbi:MAG: tail fiber domain-containing protein [Deltaproteobacteria bacterium]|nr:tail fiber domain-containing protein [Deltaproteobacteria bacterium]
MNKFIVFGALATLLTACGGTSSIGRDNGGAGEDDGGGTGGSASGGTTGAGGSEAGGSTGMGCKDDGECPAPAICRICADGSPACAKGICEPGGTCAVQYDSCGGGSGGSTGAGGSTGSGGYGGAGGTTGIGECRSNADCPAVRMPCEQCADGSMACPSVDCIAGQCSVSMPACGGGGECREDRDCRVPAICQICPDGSCIGPIPHCIAGKCATEQPACPDPGALAWYATCGAPVCGGPGGGGSTSGLPPCDAALGQKEGGPCEKDGLSCDPGYGCGESLVCATKDPTGGGMCPISRAEYKTDIQYLSREEKRALARDVRDIPIVRYRYREGSERTHLGFIIEDVEPSPSVDSERNRVDLYGYTSMAVAAVQEQQVEIQALRAELAELRAELRARRGR